MSKSYGIYLDESGEFEPSLEASGEGRQEPVRLIGGLVISPELMEQRELLRDKMEAIKARFFPGAKNISGIHMSEYRDKPASQSELRRGLEGFFNENLKRKGARFAFIYDVQQIMPEDRVSGPQLYRNMLISLLQALLFYHPEFPEDASIACNLAHRRFP